MFCGFLFHLVCNSDVLTYHQIFNMSYMMGVSSRAGNTYLSGAPEITSSFYGGSCFSVFCFLCSALCCISFWSISLQLLSIFIHVIYSLWLPPGFDIQPVITSRLWYTACDYLQALIYSLWLPPGFLSTVLILITNVYLIIEGIIMIIDDQSLDDLW